MACPPRRSARAAIPGRDARAISRTTSGGTTGFTSGTTGFNPAGW